MSANDSSPVITRRRGGKIEPYTIIIMHGPTTAQTIYVLLIYGETQEPNGQALSRNNLTVELAKQQLRPDCGPHSSRTFQHMNTTHFW
jgi:hypothetical protein